MAGRDDDRGEGRTSMNALGNDYFLSVSDELLRVVRDNLCSPCVAANLNEHDVDLDDPLNCPCRCERVKSILRNVRAIVANLDRAQPDRRKSD